MASNEEIQDEKVVNAEQEQPTKASIDIKDLYKFSPEDVTLNISTTHYSNVTYMQVAPREVILDFLEMPGIKRDGKLVVDGVRIYLSHVGAQTLVEKLGALLEIAYNDGDIAQLEFTKPEDVKLSSKISRPIKEERA